MTHVFVWTMESVIGVALLSILALYFLVIYIGKAVDNAKARFSRYKRKS